MTAPQTSLDPVAAAWLAGGAPRATDAVLVSRIERRRIRIVDGNVVDRGLHRADPFDGVLLDALGARGRRDLSTVRFRMSYDRRFEDVRKDLAAAGLLRERTAWGTRARPDRPVRTAAGRRLLKAMAADARTGAAWEVALKGRTGLTDPALREALEPPAPPEPPVSPERSRRWTRTSLEDRHLYASGAGSAGAIGAYGFTGDFGGDGGGGDGGGGF